MPTAIWNWPEIQTRVSQQWMDRLGRVAPVILADSTTTTAGWPPRKEWTAWFELSFPRTVSPISRTTDPLLGEFDWEIHLFVKPSTAIDRLTKLAERARTALLGEPFVITRDSSSGQPTSAVRIGDVEFRDLSRSQQDSTKQTLQHGLLLTTARVRIANRES